jgi:hypothetical protein
MGALRNQKQSSVVLETNSMQTAKSKYTEPRLQIFQERTTLIVAPFRK